MVKHVQIWKTFDSMINIILYKKNSAGKAKPNCLPGAQSCPRLFICSVAEICATLARHLKQPVIIKKLTSPK